MAIDFRNSAQPPKRTYKGAILKDYTKYKPFLKKDFWSRCGYTDCPDFWFGGKNNFHIDHFKPWKNNPATPDPKTDYNNLVYACSYVNILKSNDLGSYLDPCDNDFNQYFSRDNQGRIIPDIKSKSAVYMYNKLKLYMKRYQVIWMLETLYLKMSEMKKIIDKAPNGTYKNDLLKTQGELANLMVDYLKYLRSEQ